MPYLPLDRKLALLAGDSAGTPGELNYQLTQIVKRYARERGLSYATFNDITGAMESAKLEFYRRVVAPYEDLKAMQNGDVYQMEEEQIDKLIDDWISSGEPPDSCQHCPVPGSK